MKPSIALILAASLILLIASQSSARAETVMMSAEWARGMCEAWNAEPGLTENLDGWIENDEDRGFKLMRIYRRDCADGPRIEMRIARTDAGVVCIESGWASDDELTGADYVMFADTNRWQEMGEGRYGPMKGMMTGRLKFQGPKFEAMRNMGPFSNFLLLVGKVPSAIDTCPEMMDEEPATQDEALVEEEAPMSDEEPFEEVDEGANEADGAVEDGGGDGR